jgi:hypothetical protein
VKRESSPLGPKKFRKSIFLTDISPGSHPGKKGIALKNDASVFPRSVHRFIVYEVFPLLHGKAQIRQSVKGRSVIHIIKISLL